MPAGDAASFSWPFSSSPLSNTTTETAFDVEPAIRAIDLLSGRILHVFVAGRITSNISAGTLTFRLRAGGASGQLVAALTAITLPAAGLANSPWAIDLIAGIRTPPPNPTIGVVWRLEATIGATPVSTIVRGFASPSITMPVGSESVLSVTAQFSVASAGHSAILDAFFSDIR